MKVTERLITDLEEEILFVLSIQEVELSTLSIADQVCGNMKSSIPLARMHEILIQLEHSGLINRTIPNGK